MVQGSRPPTRRPMLTHLGPARVTERLARHRHRIRIDIRGTWDHAWHVAAHYLVLSPKYAAQAWWRWRDHLAIPTVIALGFILVSIPWPFALIPATGWAGYRAWMFWWAPANYEPHPFFLGCDRERFRHSVESRLNRRLSYKVPISGVEPDPIVTQAIGSVPYGFTVDQLAELEEALTASYSTRITVEPGDPGRVHLNFHHRDALAKPALYTPDPIVFPTAIPIGHDWRDQLVHGPIFQSHWLIVGTTGSGKSIFLNSIQARLATLEHADIYDIDPQGGIDLAPWKQLCTAYVDSPATGVDLLGDVLELMEERADEMADRHVTIATPTSEWPMRIVVVDEFAQLVAHPDRTLAKTASERFWKILSLGRKTGTALVAATQDPRATIISPELRALFTHTLLLKVRTQNETDVAAGKGSGLKAHRLNAAHKGRGYWIDGAGATEVATFGLYGQARDVEVARLTRLRQGHVKVASPSDQAVIDRYEQEFRDWPQPRPVDRLSLPSPPQDPGKPLTAAEIQATCRKRLEAAGRFGVRSPELAAELGVGKHRVTQAFTALRKLGICRTDGTRWIMEES